MAHQKHTKAQEEEYRHAYHLAVSEAVRQLSLRQTSSSGYMPQNARIISGWFRRPELAGHWPVGREGEMLSDNHEAFLPAKLFDEICF